MIDLKKLKPEDTGREVMYSGQIEDEEGVITSWNDKFIFVDYGNGHGIATDPKDLRFLTQQELEDRETPEDTNDDMLDMMFPNREDGDDIGDDDDY